MVDEEYPFFLCVHCGTYNHSSYIEDALQGFVFQQTSFPFLCAVVDDASTDGTSDIILKFVNENFGNNNSCFIKKEETDDYQMIIAQHKENKNCYVAYCRLKYNHYQNSKTRNKRYTYISKLERGVKYIAFCEGDDYWNDKNKLQKQVDFLESHPDYSMCFHAVEIKAEEGREWHDYFGRIEDREYTSEDTIRKWIIPTCSILYRMEINSKIPTNPHFVFGDDVIYSTCLMYGKIYGMSARMGVYRLVPTGWMASNTGTKRLYSSISQRKGLMEEFPFYRCDINYNYMESVYYQLMYTLLKRGSIKEQIQVLKDYRQTLPTSSTFRFVVYFVKSLLQPLKQMLVRNNKKLCLILL